MQFAPMVASPLTTIVPQCGSFRPGPKRLMGIVYPSLMALRCRRQRRNASAMRPAGDRTRLWTYSVTRRRMSHRACGSHADDRRRPWQPGATVIPVAATGGFAVGQSITIGAGALGNVFDQVVAPVGEALELVAQHLLPCLKLEVCELLRRARLLVKID